MKISSKRAEYAALTALILSLLFSLIVLLIGKWTGSVAVSAIAWQILAGMLIWVVLTIQFHMRSLAQQEKLDMAQLASMGDSTTIFQNQQSAMFETAQKRLVLFEKWFAPIIAGLIAVYQVAIGIYLYNSIDPKADILINQPLIASGFLAGIAFVSFLISRYTIGMSVEPEWRPLRSGGSYLLASALLCFAAAVAMTLVQFKSVIVMQLLQWVPPVLMVLLGAETLFNLILDIYRPRLKGQYSRAAYESRLLGFISEPGGILYTTASALDYQFGFKVSQTWFFRLLEKAIVPLILFSIVIIYLLSCVVVIDPQEEGIKERFGKPINVDKPLGPGIQWKLPWPMEIVYTYPTKRVQQVSIGFVPELDENGITKRQPLLWDVEHYKEEYNLLTATSTSNNFQEGAVPVSIIRATVPVQYRVKDLYKFLYNHQNSEELLSAICYREVVQFVASSTIETDADNDSDNLSLLGAGRATAALKLKERIQKRADENGLGIEIVFLGLQGFHPPPKVAGDYEAVIGSVQKKQALILNSMAMRNRVLTMLAGSVDKANELYKLAALYQTVKHSADAETAKQQEGILDKAFTDAKGEIFSTLRQAQSDSFVKSSAAKADSTRFEGQLIAYRAAQKIYKNEQMLSMLEESLEPIRKYVTAIDPEDSEVLIIDLQEKLTPSLYELSGIESKDKK